MKRVSLFIFGIFTFLIFTSNASALDEYRLDISGANTITVRKSTNGSTYTKITDSSQYEDALSYSNGVLTLKEGAYFNYIYAEYDNIVITSNNKKVYLNVLMDSSNTANRTINIDKLNSETYVTTIEPSSWFGNKSLGYYIYHYFQSSGAMTIKDSTIDLRLKTPASFNSVQNGLILPLYNLTITNSTIISEGPACPMNANTTLIIEDSNITVLNEHDQGGIFSMNNGTVKVKDSTITGKTGIGFSGTGSYLKNSTLDFEGSIYISSSVDIEDSIIKGKYFYYRCPTGNVTNIRRSDLTITDKFTTGLYNNNDKFSDVLYIEDSNISSVVPFELVYGSELHLLNTKFDVKNIYSIDGTSDSKVVIEKGENNLDYIDIAGTTQITDSTLTLPSEGYIKSDSAIDLENVNDLDIDYIKGGDISIDTTNINLSGVLSGGNTGIWDSTVNTHGTRIIGSFDLFDTYYKTITLSSENTYSPFIVKGDVDIDNSRLIADSDGTVPAVIVTGNVTLNEGSSFKDDNRKLLTVSDITVSNDNFLSSSSTYGNAEYVSVGDTIKSTTLNNELTYYAETDGYYEVTVKVVNGSWEDGTVEDVTIKVLLGDEPDAYLPTSMVANKGYKKGSWKLDDDGKYVYTFVKDAIVNPKTGVASLTGLLVVSIFLIILLNKYKNNISLFKNI